MHIHTIYDVETNMYIYIYVYTYINRCVYIIGHKSARLPMPTVDFPWQC